MKIHGNDDICKSLISESKPKTRQSAGPKFGAILKETVENSKNIVSSPQQTAFVNPMFRIQPSSPAAADQQGTIERIENLLDVLEQYRQKLADRRVTLKTIDPIMTEMITEKENLAPALDALPDGDGLKDIVNQALVTASLEITKFYRGDYIPS